MAKSPQIRIACLMASGGLSFLNFFEIAKANKNHLPESISEVSKLSKKDLGFSSEGDDPLIGKSRTQKVTAGNVVTPPIQLQLLADRQSYDARKKRYVAEGKVSLNIDGASLKADRIEFDRSFRTLFANGRVRFKKGRQYLQATSFRYSLIQKIGELNDVYGIIDLKSLDTDLKLSSQRRIYDNNFGKIQGIKVVKTKKANVDLTSHLVSKSNKNLPSLMLEGNILNKPMVKLIPPLNVWSSPGENFLFSIPSFAQNDEIDGIACPPSLPSIPDWQPYSWALTTWGGQMTHSDFGEAFIFTGDARDENLFGVGLSKRIYRNGPIALEFELDWLKHSANSESGGPYQARPFAATPAQNFWEGIVGVGARFWLKPWLNIAFIEGISYNSQASNYETTNRNKQSQLLNYLGAEIEALLSERFSLVGRVHHRSGAFGTFGGVKGGSNAYLIGFRYRWGKNNKVEQSTLMNAPPGCLAAERLEKKLEKSIDQNLEVIPIGKLSSYPRLKMTNTFLDKNYSQDDFGLLKTDSSNLSITQQEVLRTKLIDLIDQKINSLEIRDTFGIQGRLGIQRPSSTTEERNQPGSVDISQINPKASSKLVTGSISRWRLQASKIKVNQDGWQANRMSFTNDPFTPTQTRIDAENVIAKEIDNGDILITASRSRLILEERVSIPIVKSVRIKKSESVENRWVFGVDQGDRDGLFIGRSMRPILLGENYKLSLQPQFLIQRAAKNKTNSYVAKGAPVTSDNVGASTTAADLFGMKGKLRGDLYGFDLSLDANISTFNIDRLLDGSRYWGSLKRAVQVPFVDEINTTLFAAYRYKVWNGSIRETDIYTAYGGFLEKSIDWNWGKFQNTYLFRYGLGNYQAETLEGGSLSELWRTNLYSSLKSEYVIWQENKPVIPIEKAYRYSPIPISPGLTFDTNLSTAYFLYEDGSNQQILSFTAGPTLTLGNFSEPFLDYTKLSIFSGASLKKGESPFAFDQVVDLATLGIGLTQQIAGPLVLNTGFKFNIDGGSSYYGRVIDSNVEFRWQRRSYDLGVFYNPSRGVGGISFHLNDFSFNGTGIPFVPYEPSRLNVDNLANPW